MKSASFRYFLYSMGFMILFVIGCISLVAGIVLGFKEKNFAGFFEIILYIVGSASLVVAFILRPKQQALREEAAAEKEREGKGKTYKTASKEERRKMDLERMMKNEKILSVTEYKNLLKDGSKNPDADMANLTGLSAVKKEVERLAVQMELNMDKGKKRNEKNGYHVGSMAFLGNPGTGKTTVAGIITGYLYQFGYINKNEFIAVDGNFLKAGLDPIERTNMLLARARGKVLFVDEAYAFVKGGSGIGEEVLATIINEMENHRDELIVIFAGYKKEMKELFNVNSGFTSRIKTYLFFEDYDYMELRDIFSRLINKESLVITDEALARFDTVVMAKKKKRNFANARTVRNIAEKAIIEHALNVKQGKYTEDGRFKLMSNDIVDDSAFDNYMG